MSIETKVRIVGLPAHVAVYRVTTERTEELSAGGVQETEELIQALDAEEAGRLLTNLQAAIKKHESEEMQLRERRLRALTEIEEIDRILSDDS